MRVGCPLGPGAISASFIKARIGNRDFADVRSIVQNGKLALAALRWFWSARFEEGRLPRTFRRPKIPILKLDKHPL